MTRSNFGHMSTTGTSSQSTSVQNEPWLCAKMSMNTPDKDAFLHSKAAFISLRVKPQSHASCANSNSHTAQIYKET